MRQAAAAVLLVFVFVCGCHADFARTVYTAEISNAGAIPSVGPEDSFGLAVCVYERNVEPHTMDCEVHHNVNVQDKIVSSDIYLRTSADSILLYRLYANETINEFRVVFPLVDLTLSSIGSYSVAEQEYDFLNGNWEIEITSDQYEQGEARGTLLHDRRFYARLDGEDVVPPVNTIASGLATVSYQFQPSKVAEFQVVHSVASPTGAFVGKGFPGVDGSNEFNMVDFSSPIFSERRYTAATEDDIFDGEEFIEVTSGSEPLGEIRGQLVPIDYLPPVSFTARLDGDSVQPNSVLTRSRGAALFSVDCDTGYAEYIVYHDVDGATETWLNFGNSAERGQRLFPLARAGSPIFGELIFSEEHIVAFYKQQLFITVETVVFPDGEIRGQLSDKYDWYAYLSGTNVVPPVTSSGVGIATFRLAEETDNGRVLDYEVVFSLPLTVQPYVVELLAGAVGGVGTPMRTFTEHTSPVAGVDVRLSRTELNQFGSEQTFISIGPDTLFDQIPYLRGQVLHIRNPCPFITELPPGASTPTSSFDEFALQSSFQFDGSERLVPTVLLVVAALVLLLC